MGAQKLGFAPSISIFALALRETSTTLKADRSPWGFSFCFNCLNLTACPTILPSVWLTKTASGEVSLLRVQMFTLCMCNSQELNLLSDRPRYICLFCFFDSDWSFCHCDEDETFSSEQSSFLNPNGSLLVWSLPLAVLPFFSFKIFFDASTFHFRLYSTSEGQPSEHLVWS